MAIPTARIARFWSSVRGIPFLSSLALRARSDALWSLLTTRPMNLEMRLVGMGGGDLRDSALKRASRCARFSFSFGVTTLLLSDMVCGRVCVCRRPFAPPLFDAFD
tara:strand:+ start:541 stop:858 length:318 start_codon:yes stop_codon:yes gene_type:complete